MKTKPELIAASFRALLLAAIGAAPLREVDTLNAAEANPNACHSHDYCDANEYMAEAFAALVGRPIDLQSDADLALWSAAWKQFRADGKRTA